jgi:hypothetical protein
MSTWNPVPPPPAPTGINNFPSTPPVVKVSQVNLPDQTVDLHPGLEFGPKLVNKLTNQVLTVTGKWEKVVSCTASPETPFNQTDSVTTGTSTTNTTTKSFSDSLGVAESFLSISASMTESFSHSVTVSESKTISQEFQVTPKEGEISAIWWQMVYTYTITGTSTIVFGSQAFPSKSFTKELVNSAKTFVSTIYPASTVITTKGFEEFS